MTKLRLNNWPNVCWKMEGIFWWNFFLQLLGRRHCHKPKRNLFSELFSCLICEKSHPQKPSGSPESVLENFLGLVSPLRPNGKPWISENALLDRLARDFIGLNSLGHRMKLTQNSILYCFLIVHEISSKSVKISAQQMFMNVIKSLQFLRRIVKSAVHHQYHCATENRFDLKLY